MSDEETPVEETKPKRRQSLLEEQTLTFLRLHEWGNNAMLCGLPFGYVEWADQRFEVYCATPAQFAELTEYLDKRPFGDGYHVARDGTPEQVAHCAFLAFGGERRSPLSEEDLQRIPQGFALALQEAVLGFLWVGPACAVSKPIPEEERERHKAKG